jgi:hypothetical protein
VEEVGDDLDEEGEMVDGRVWEMLKCNLHEYAYEIIIDL